MGGKKSLMKLKRMIVKLKWSMKLLHPIRTTPSSEDDDLEGMMMTWSGGASATLEEVVPKGHFTVLAGEQKFVLELKLLRNPAMLMLLKQAEEEFGYQQQPGALVVPCMPHELQMIVKHNYL